MKFHIFSFWENKIKTIIYVIIAALTMGIIYYYFHLNEGMNALYTFGAPVIYALILFIAGLAISKNEKSIAEKLYEREGYYLSLCRLRETTNATINTLDDNDFNKAESRIIMFQLLTGRSPKLEADDDNSRPYIKENGFIYTSEMLLLESDTLSSIRIGNDENECRKKLRKLIRYYKRCNRKLEKNYCRLKTVYGGNLQNLVERDNEASDTDYYLRELVSKADDISYEIDELVSNGDDLENQISELKAVVKDLQIQMNENADNIEALICANLDSNNQ